MELTWDAHLTRWLHCPYSAWLLFGVCTCIAPSVCIDTVPEVSSVTLDKNFEGLELMSVKCDKEQDNEVASDYKVICSFFLF
ncbi:OTU domain-containing protein [Sesbania bispinosa]|nr:OTU domain-containing protein [Sesbania bispinosa]